jgi:hypothetical protein
LIKQKDKKDIKSSFALLQLSLPKAFYLKTFFFPLFEGKKWQKPLSFYKAICFFLPVKATTVNSCYPSKSFFIIDSSGNYSRYC